MNVEIVIRVGGQPLLAELDDTALAAITNAVRPKHEPDPTSPWMTVPVAADYLGLSEHATRKFIDRHHIDKHQHIPGGRILVHRDDLDAALNRC